MTEARHCIVVNSLLQDEIEVISAHGQFWLYVVM